MSSVNLLPYRHLLLDLKQNHLSLNQVYARDKHFGDEIRQLARREVYNRFYQATEQVFFLVKFGRLGTGLINPQFAEIDPQLVSRLVRFGEVLNTDDAPNPHFNFLKIGKTDNWHN